MSSRSTRRRRHKRHARVTSLPVEASRAEAARLLAAWQSQARSRAGRLSAATAWSLAGPAVEARALALDATGELLAELHRLIAEAIAEAAAQPLVSVSKPAAERSRLHHER